jgi:hypothetical protein
MRKLLLACVAVAAIGSVCAAAAFAAAGDTPLPSPAAEAANAQQEHAAMLEAHLAGLKAGLQLTADQEKNWPPLEAAIRAAAKAHEEGLRQMRERNSAGERPSPIERLRMMSDHMSKMSAELTALADAGKPLYDSLTDAQKRVFGPLLREFVERRARDASPTRHGDGEGAPGRME